MDKPDDGSFLDITMHGLSASELLNVWEMGISQPSARRALMLLAAACPEVSPDALAGLTIGQRDARLLMLREWAFGSQVVSVATCPGCHKLVELTFDVSDIRIASEIESSEMLSVNAGEYAVQFRLPNSSDLLAVAEYQDVAAVRRVLIGRCLLAAHHAGQDEPVVELPTHVIEALIEQMAEADPQADVQLMLSCPWCACEWQAAFDIVSYFWSEINAWGSRILREVHALAFAYGWRESDILAMSPWRRQAYLEMVGG